MPDEAKPPGEVAQRLVGPDGLVPILRAGAGDQGRPRGTARIPSFGIDRVPGSAHGADPTVTSDSLNAAGSTNAAGDAAGNADPEAASDHAGPGAPDVEAAYLAVARDAYQQRHRGVGELTLDGDHRVPPALLGRGRPQPFEGSELADQLLPQGPKGRGRRRAVHRRVLETLGGRVVAARERRQEVPCRSTPHSLGASRPATARRGCACRRGPRGTARRCRRRPGAAADERDRCDEDEQRPSDHGQSMLEQAAEINDARAVPRAIAGNIEG